MRAALLGAAVASVLFFAATADAQAAPTPAPPAAWEYRLTGGDATTYGRLEARPSTSNSWGSVCDDSFDIDDARVACRSLGLTPPLPQNLSFRTARSGESASTSAPVYFDDLACNGAETTLQSCARAAKHNCDHEEDIMLSCATSVYPNTNEYRLVGGVNNTYGRLEVRPSPILSWGTVCDDFFDANDALVACRSLGFAVSNATTDVAFRRAQPGECGSNSQLVRMDNLNCDGTESELAHCSQTSSPSCSHVEDMVVSCGVNFVPAITSWQVRLTGGTSNTNGIVEVKPDGHEWGTVCSSGFGTADAQATCRGLGLATDTVSFRMTSVGEYGLSSVSSHVMNVACTGTEASLDKCPSQSTCSSCDFRSAVMVSCGSATVPKPWEYRLVDGNASYGRLEVRPSVHTPWGSVCDDNFDANDAIVACRSLGLTTTPSAFRTATQSYDQGSGNIWMGNLFCANTEAKLHDCARSTFNCGHNEDIWLSCGSSAFPDTWEYRLVAGGSNYGRLEMRPNTNSAWGTSCITGFGSFDATVACRALGLPTSTVGHRIVTTGEGAPLSAPIYMRSLGCSGTEARPDVCSYSTSTTGCSHTSTDVMLSCGMSTVPQSWEYRLVAGTDDNNGRLEVRPHNDTVWGSVCDDSFGAVDASIACKSLGRNHTVVGFRKAEVGEATTWQPTWMDDLACNSFNSQLAFCSRTSFPNCDASESIMLACGNTTVAKDDRMHYRLADGNKTGSGRLEVRMGAKGAWSTVCATGWGASQTRTVCNALGLDSRVSAFRSANAGERAVDPVPVYAEDFTCSGNNETSLQQCTAAQRTATCSHDNDVVIACGESSVPTLWQYALGSALSATSGNGSVTVYGGLAVRVGNYSNYQFVCDTNFGFNDAKVFCRAMGYSEAADAGMVGFRTVNVPEDGTAYGMDDLACAGTEASPDVCTRSTSAPSCGPGHAMVVSCGNTTVPSLYTYRLTGGNATYGRLEAKVTNNGPAETYATICTVGFDANAAAASCRAMGLNSTVVSFRIAAAEERGSAAQRTTNFTGMACAADSIAPDVCLTNDGTAKCDHSTDVILACGHSSVPSIWQHRLVGGGANWGRVEVRPNGEAPWGTVCNDAFGTNDATTVCRALGLPTSPVYFNSANSVGVAVGDSTQPTYIDDVACSGTESSIGECTFSKTEDCSHIEDIMVVCGGSAVPVATQYRLVGGDPRVHGRLEVRTNTSANWGTVCAEGFDVTDAAVACKSLGLSSVRMAWRASNFGEGGAAGQPIAMSNLACSISNTELAYCTYSATNGGIDPRCNRHDNDVLLGCGVSAVPSSWEYRLVGGTETFGRLETRPNPAAAWGVVCPLGFGAKEATIACQSLNLTHTSSAFRAGNSAGEYALASQPSWMENLGCIGTETALDQCPRAGAVTCNRESTVMLVCGATAFPQTYEYRLAAGTETHGRLEVRAAGTEPWGTVCSADANAARVACRALGLSTTAVGVRAAAANEQGAAGQLVAMSGVTCSTGSESSFSACTLTTPADGACGRAQDSAVACGVATVPTFWQYRLVTPNGTMATGNVGRLEARENSGLPWGMACDDMFTAASARVACASMGKPSTEASFRRATALERGRSDQPVTLDDVVCTGNETELSLCSRAAAGAINCGFEQAVVVSCGTSALPETTAVWQYRLVGGSDEYGRLEARQSYTGTWGAVCGDTFAQADALVACRSLGFFGSNVSFRTAATSAEEGTRLQPTAIATLSCTGPETHLGQCGKAANPAAVSTCTRSKDIIIACGTTAAPLPVRSTAAMAASGGSEWEYRLVGGSVSAGRLELRRRGDAVWGTACASGFDMNAAKAACAGLGFSGAQGYGQTFGANGDTVVHMDQLMCTGTEARLDYCGYRTEHNCRQWDSVRLDCAPTPLPSSPAQLAADLATPWTYRLSAGDSFSSGRLEAKRPGESTWGSVCAVNFTKADAVVACRALGLPISPVSFRNASVAPSAMLAAARGSADLLPPLAASTAPIALQYLTCTGSEARPELCTRWVNPTPSNATTSCDHSRDVVLTCGAERVPLAAGFRLSGSGWAAVLADAAQTATLRGNVAADVAEIAGVAPASLIKVTNMNVGSLIVNVSMLAASPAEADRFGRAFNATEGQNLTQSGGFGRVRSMYAANTPQGQAGEDVNVSAAVANPDPAAQAEPAPSRGGPPAEEEDGFSCEIGSDCSYIVLLVLVILVILCVVVAILLALKSNAAAAAGGASASSAAGAKDPNAKPQQEQKERGGVVVADDTNGDGTELVNVDPAVWTDPAGPPPARDARPDPVEQ